MPQRITDDDLDGLVEHSEHQLKIAELGKPSLYCFTDDLVLDLRDARAELEQVRCYWIGAEERITKMGRANVELIKQLKIAIGALESAKETLQAIEQDYIGNGHLSKEWRDIDTALDQIKGITDATTNK